MKLTRFLFAMVVCGAMSHENGTAESSNRGPDQRPPGGIERAAGKPVADGSRNIARASDKTGKAIHPAAIRPAPKLPQSMPNRSAQKPADVTRARIPSGTSVNTRQFATFKPAGAAKKDLAPGKVAVENKPLNARDETLRPQGAVPLAGSSFNTAYHHASEPTSLGGPMFSAAKSTAALNGTGFRKRGD
jgi:hypothetical protein